MKAGYAVRDCLKLFEMLYKLGTPKWGGKHKGQVRRRRDEVGTPILKPGRNLLRRDFLSPLTRIVKNKLAAAKMNFAVSEAVLTRVNFVSVCNFLLGLYRCFRLEREDTIHVRFEASREWESAWEKLISCEKQSYNYESDWEKVILLRSNLVLVNPDSNLKEDHHCWT